MAFATVDEYIASFPADIQKKLEQIRAALHKGAPDATEKMSWQMPTLWQRKNLIHFAAFKDHLSIFPGPEAVDAFAPQLGPYVCRKGTIQFRLDQDLPAGLIAGIAGYCAEQISRV